MIKLDILSESRNYKLKITQTGSSIGRKYDQQQTLIGLGLNKLHKVAIIEDTPSIRGMIKKVNHLIKVEDN
ncbi:MAG: 50S ribosomal protein L30 [Rickettsiaceae bacterium]|nr:MAG: 50S ribosomal protein L30 [Rickettsiaceae bacterium]